MTRAENAFKNLEQFFTLQDSMPTDTRKRSIHCMGTVKAVSFIKYIKEKNLNIDVNVNNLYHISENKIIIKVNS